MAQTAQLRRIDTIENEAQRIFSLQREAYLRDPYPSAEQRIERLEHLDHPDPGGIDLFGAVAVLVGQVLSDCGWKARLAI